MKPSELTWEQGQMVTGIYFGQPYSGTINNNTRATPDGKNIIFGVTLFDPITVFGSIRHNIQIHISEISNTINL